MLIEDAKPPIHHSLIMACHITGVYDVNRNQTIPHDDISIVKQWADSIAAQKLHGVLFHNGFSKTTVDQYQNKYIQFVKIHYNETFNPNVFRYFVYLQYLQQYASTINHCFVTDVADVVLINNPFISSFYLNRPNTLFCGDEPLTLNNNWMHAHATHLRNKIVDFTHFEAAFEDATLLNCGIIGGNAITMRQLLSKLCHIHETYNYDNKTLYTGDMGAFNYLMRTRFNKLLHHGFPCNTVFKAYEINRTDCWFRHK